MEVTFKSDALGKIIIAEVDRDGDIIDVYDYESGKSMSQSDYNKVVNNGFDIAEAAEKYRAECWNGGN